MSRSKRSPPATPPAVLMSTASSSRARAPGKCMRSPPASCSRTRRVIPRPYSATSAMRPTARFAANTCALSSARLISQCQRALERRLVHVGLAAGVDDGTAVHDGKIVAELAREVEILLDQHDRDLAEVAQIGDGPADVLDDRRLDALGRLVEQEHARPHDERAADGELLLLAAREVAAAPAQHVAEHRKQ